MRYIDINTWERKQHYNHFKDFLDPNFAVTIPFDVTNAYNFAKHNNISFFAKYLHDCMRAINSVDNLKYRIIEDKVVEFDVINASATLMRANNTFALSSIKYSEDIKEFIKNINSEKQRILSTDDFYPPENKLDCIHCSALPWVNFTNNKEAFSGKSDSVPKLSFGKVYEEANCKKMNVSISVSHALVDGLHVGFFAENFQQYLNNN